MRGRCPPRRRGRRRGCWGRCVRQRWTGCGTSTCCAMGLRCWRCGRWSCGGGGGRGWDRRCKELRDEAWVVVGRCVPGLAPELLFRFEGAQEGDDLGADDDAR